MWGRLVPASVGSALRGNTPTHVGKTVIGHSLQTNSEKHPHACGEDFHPWLGLLLNMETPPRMWGRRCMKFWVKVRFGNTPTHVGKTV